MKLKTCLLVLIFAGASPCFSQVKTAKEIYKPFAPYSGDELEDDFTARERFVTGGLSAVKEREYFKAVSGGLKRIAAAENFLNDPSTESYLNGILSKLIAANNLNTSPVRVLILRSSVSNGYSFGEGTFAITTGMLAQLRSEEELAFLLAHELAHYQASHALKQIREYLKPKPAAKNTKGMNRDEIVLSQVDSVKKLFRLSSQFRQKHEFEADSLGFIYLTKAGYNPDASLHFMTLLDSLNGPELNSGELLRSTFESSKIPFEQRWLKPRLSVFERQLIGPAFFENDSLSTHPDIIYRTQKLQSFAGLISPAPRAGSILFANYSLENIESALFRSRYDKALMLAMDAIPDASPAGKLYLKELIVRMMTELYHTKDAIFERGVPTFTELVPEYTGGYPEDLRTVNTFLNHLTKDEFGEIAFDYMNRKGNFDPDVEIYYLRLWLISDATGRNEVKTKVKAAYLKRFPDGQYTRSFHAKKKTPEIFKFDFR